MNITEDIAMYWLSLSGASTRRINKMLEVFSACDIWDAVKQESVKNFLGERNYNALLRFKNCDYLESSLNNLDKSGIKIITRSSNKFPQCLAQDEVDPPVVLYYKGNIDLLNTDCVAIVGTRKSSYYGRDMARKFARELSESGLTIVSGLATGIDGYAHEEVLKCGGKTIAVMGTGHNRPFPQSNYNLFLNIAEKGLVISEYEPNTEGSKYTFPNRNRIISGLSRATVVIEAGLKSGSLITAQFALEQGRELCVVPGHVGAMSAMGSNEYLRDKLAHAVLCGRDVCSTIDFIYEKTNEKYVSIQLDIYEEKIYNLLQNGDLNLDKLVEMSGLNISEVAATISSLEVMGLIKRKNANIFCLA